MNLFTALPAAALIVACALFAGSTAAQAPQSAPAQSPPAQSPATMSPEQIQTIERIIRDYLMRNPEVIIEAVEGLEQRRRDEAQRASKVALVQFRDEIFNDPYSVTVGNPQGDVTLVEFFDYRCPYCKQVVPALTQLIKEDGKLRFVYKELPILGPDSVVASRAAIAARRQNKYVAFHDALMKTRGALDEATVMKVAAEAGLDIARLKTDMTLREVDDTIERNRRLAQALAITGTPAFVVGDMVVPGAVDLPTLKSLVAQARKK